ncbi:MAG: SpoIIE family protein phosphatase, partial [Planctomycetota bacterium]
DYPLYFQALDEERAIVANDAATDPRTSEFSEGYLDVNGITSMMDTPLYSRGTVIGVVCHEHIGPPRVWTTEEQQFAGSLADLATRALESSDRRQAEESLRESEKRTREILVHALDAIVTVGEDSVITEWNPRAEIVFGWSHEEVIGKSLFDTVIPERDHRNHRVGMLQFLETGEGSILNQRVEVTARDKAGREFPVELSISPMRIGDTWVFSAFVRDITARVRAEQEIHELNARLEERVHERTDQLNTAVVQKEHLLQDLRANSIELVDKLCELEHKSEVIAKDLARAQIIQRALLPAQAPHLEMVHVDALYRPGMNVGGDLYDVASLEDGLVALYVADATGHGVCAAMLSVLFKQRLEMCDESGRALDPSEVLRRVNDRLCGDVLTPGLFLTAAYILLDTKTYELRAASAGHTPMLLRRANGETLLLERTGPALGIEEHPRFLQHELTLRQGDRLILYTDGLTDGLEASGPAGIRELLLPALTGDSTEGPRRLRRLYNRAKNRARDSANGDGVDDVTLLLLEVGDGSSHLDNDPAIAVPVTDDIIPQPSTSPPPKAPGGDLWIAEGEQETYLAVRGRGTWTSSDTFRSLALASLNSGKRLTIDLAGCAYLDSAFLGTLHEIVVGDGQGLTSVLSPRPAVRETFRELGLERVLAAVRDDAAAPPSEPSPVTQRSSSRENQRRLLRAHETLAALSEENRSRFASVVEALRRELGEKGPD